MHTVALTDITPLYKYLVGGKDATKVVNRVITSVDQPLSPRPTAPEIPAV